MNFNNTFNSYDDSTQNISINYDISAKGDWKTLEQALKKINVQNEQLEELRRAIEEDKQNGIVNNEKVLTKTKEAAKKIVAFVATSTASASISLTVKAVAHAISTYFGFPVQF